MQLLKLRNRAFFTVFFSFFISIVAGQELNCKVSINTTRVQSTDLNIFKDMEQNITQFMNSRKWTNDNFKNYERINCRILLNIQMVSIGSYKAEAQITSTRPIFNSTYESVVLNFSDREWSFEYLESQQIQYTDNNYLNNLSSLLAYYAYIIIGMDYDSFSELGGEQYFQKAFQVVNIAQQSNRPGWETIGSLRNRYAFVSNIINPQMVELRKNTYKYHRLALDNYQKKPDDSRQIMLEVLKNVKSAYLINPTSILVIAFFDAKSSELVSIFSEGDLGVRRQVFDILQVVDPKRTNYQAIIGQ